MPDDNDDDIEAEGNEDSSVIRSLRAELKKAKGDAAEVQGLRQELAIAKAGITTLTDRQRKALVATHEGEWNAEALKETATDLGFIKAEAPAKEEQVSPDEQEQLQRVQAATADAEAVDARPDDLDAKIANAKNPAELQQIMEAAGVGWNSTEV